MNRSATGGFVIILGLLTGCGQEEELPPRIVFDTATVAIVMAADTMRMKLEVADDSSERGYGLMDRDTLGAETGMLFLFQEPQDSGSAFHMYRTRIPLDIAFMDSTGVIVSIVPMEPCRSPVPHVCTSYSPGVRYYSALETNRGFFGRHRIGVGAKVIRGT